eukprot:UN00314
MIWYWTHMPKLLRKRGQQEKWRGVVMKIWWRCRIYKKEKKKVCSFEYCRCVMYMFVGCMECVIKKEG